MAKTQEKKYQTRGILRGVEHTQAPDKSWKRAALKIEKDGKTTIVSTFEEKDILLANQSNGKEVELTYTNSQKGEITYKNLVKGGLKAIGQGEAPVTEAEEVVDDDIIDETTEEESKVIMTEKEGRKMGKNPPIIYPPDTQTMIVRQNSWTQANKYIENMIKAVEVGILKEAEVENTDLNIEKVKEVAHQVEEDIMRSK